MLAMGGDYDDAIEKYKQVRWGLHHITVTAAAVAM
jgi:hypothetical protein